MPYRVVFTRDAEADLESIYDYIVEYDSLGKAEYVLEQLLKATDRLTHFPEQGRVPHELQNVSMYDYRQILFKPYRLIYQIVNQQVVIFVITDGRRDMQTLLIQRLLK